MLRHVDAATKDRLRIFAAVENTSMSELASRLLTEALAHQEEVAA